MAFKVEKFSVPKGQESLFGEIPYSVEFEYEASVDDGEVGVIQWQLVAISGSEESILEDGVKVLNGSGEFSFESIVDVAPVEAGKKIVLRTRLFTADSMVVPQVTNASFTVKPPAKGKADLALPAPYQGTVEAQPGGYVSCKVALEAAGNGDWCLALILTDNTGDVKSTAELADEGRAAVSAGMAGKPKSLEGEIMVFGANGWMEFTAAL